MFSPAQIDHAVANNPPLAELERKVRALDRSRTDCDLLVGAGGLDLYSTAYALNKNPDADEGNPLGFSPEARIALKAVTIPMGCYLSRKLRLGGHDHWATGLTLVNVTAHVVVSILNFRSANK